MSMSRSLHERRTFLIASLAGAIATMIVFAGLSRAESVPLPSIHLASVSAAPLQLQAVIPSSPIFALAASADAPDAAPPAPPSAAPAPVAAPSLTVPPDPVDDPAGAIDALRAAWRDGRLLGTTLVALYLLILVAKRYVSWLATGRRAVVVAALTTALVTAISTLTSGTASLAWAIEAISVGVLLYLRSETQAKGA